MERLAPRTAGANDGRGKSNGSAFSFPCCARTAAVPAPRPSGPRTASRGRWPGGRLPLGRQQAVPLQVAERAVVGEHVEAIAGALECAARLVTTIRAATDIRAEDCGAIVGREAPGDGQQLVVRQRRYRIERR